MVFVPAYRKQLKDTRENEHTTIGSMIPWGKPGADPTICNMKSTREKTQMSR